MDDRIVWQAGDEFRCKKCDNWHRTFVADASNPRYMMDKTLRFVCPQSAPGAYFCVEVIGQPVHEIDRWRRPLSASS